MDAPLITFVLIAYNQEEYVAEAIVGAFSQTYSPLEIILSDDCSDDRTFEIMRGMAGRYQGPHKIRINRNESNLGLIGHVNKVFSMAAGKLIVIGAGDDVSLPERSERLHNLWHKTGYQADGLCSGYVVVSPEGEQVRPVPQSLTIEEICGRGTVRLRGATAGWSRRLIERWGPLPPESLAEDRVLSFRALLGGGLVGEPLPLVRYRADFNVDLQTQSGWSARRVWEFERINQFYGVFLNDLARWIQREQPQGKNPERWQRLLQRNFKRTQTDARTLGGGRLGVFLYCLRLLAGVSHYKPPPLGRIMLVLSLFRRRVLGNEKQPMLEASDYQALRNDAGG